MALSLSRSTNILAPKPAPTLSMFAPSPTASSALGALVGGMNAPAPATPIRPIFTAPPPSFNLNSSNLLTKYAPATTGATTTIPVPSQAPPRATVPGMFATLGTFGAPQPSLLAKLTSPPAPPIRASGINAPSLGTRPTTLLQSVRDVTSRIAPFNPPMTPPAVGPVTPDAYLPPGMPPATPAASTASAAASTAIPGGGGMLDQGYPADAVAGVDPHATPASGPSLGTMALYGAAGLGGLFLLSKMFKGSSAA